VTAKTTAAAGKTVKRKTVARKSSKASKAKSSKLTAAQKHAAHVKHEQHVAHEEHLTAIGKAPKVTLARAGDHLPVCAFEALAMSLRLAGQFVHDDDVAGLWDLAGADSGGASVAAALDAARLHGLAGFRPQSHRLTGIPEVGAFAQDLLALPAVDDEAAPPGHVDDILSADFHGLILGVDRPGPHAVLATADGWWSWGELHDPWPCSVTGAWAVSWS
jgi:hypothetical protein